MARPETPRHVRRPSPPGFHYSEYSIPVDPFVYQHTCGTDLVVVLKNDDPSTVEPDVVTVADAPTDNTPPELDAVVSVV